MRAKFGSIYRRGLIWWVKYSRNGRIFRESAHTENRAEAERLLKRRLGDIVTGRFAGLGPERLRMENLFSAVVEDYRLNGRKSMVHLESRLRLHLLPAFADLRTADLGSDHVRRYVAMRLNQGAQNATINRELEILARALALGAASDPPKVLRVIHVPMLPERNIRTGFLDDGGYLRLRQELPEYLRPLLVVGYHLGNRLGELRLLRWDWVDFANAQIQLPAGVTKNGRGRVLPIYGEMRPWLEMARAERDAVFPDCPYVFQTQGRPIGEFRKAWRAACERAGVPGLLFHDLRRSAIRNMRLAGVPEHVAMEISGHRTRAVFDRYSIVGGQDLRDAAVRMEQRFREATGTGLGTILGTISDNGRLQ
jgi:integrase